MNKSQKKKAIKNVSFRIDEVHHVAGVAEEIIEANQLGKFCKYLLDNDGSLHACTATFFRSDLGMIIGDEYLKDFEIYRVPFLDYWNILGIEEFHQSYHTYKDAEDLMNQILKSCRSELDEHHLIIVPADKKKFFRKTNKKKWTTTLVEELEKIYGKENVLDLVTPKRQKKDKERLNDEVKTFKAVVTCMIGKEGSDWPPCSRIHNTLLDGSVLPIIQKLGRGFRPFKNKTTVRMFNYIEHFESWDSDPEVIRARLSDRFNAIATASMFDDMFFPVSISVPRKSREKSNKSKTAPIYLEDVYGSNREKLIQDLMRRFLAIPVEDRDKNAVDEVIHEVIDDYADRALIEVPEKSLRDRLRIEIVSIQNPDKDKLVIRSGGGLDFIRKHGGWDNVVKKHVANGSAFVGKANCKELKKLYEYMDGDGFNYYLKQLEQLDSREGMERGTDLYTFAQRMRNMQRRYKAKS